MNALFSRDGWDQYAGAAAGITVLNTWLAFDSQVSMEVHSARFRGSHTDLKAQSSCRVTTSSESSISNQNQTNQTINATALSVHNDTNQTGMTSSGSSEDEEVISVKVHLP